jgi:nitroimidazol reductase NimA-like FMN-containing flavoprotein (pyridoxamine 5'-phosphate oxidase superfamily)
MNEPFELSEAQCVELLRAGLVGRAALCTPTGPHIIPVNYSVVDDAVIVRTTPYSILGSQARGSDLALEIDHFDYERHLGWSVLVRGRADVVTEAAELEHIQRTWNPVAWAAGSRNVYLRLPWSQVSGRRLGVGGDPSAGAPEKRVV